MAEASSTVAAPLHLCLPDEVVIWEIRVRLPPTSLLRCRAVCRGWHRATSTREFLLAHHDRQPCLPLLYNYDYDHSDIVHFDHRAGVAAADQLHSVAQLGSAFFDLEATCDGLLVLSDHSNQLYVYNPATRQFASLQHTSGFIILGMYPHHNTGEYRLLLYRESVDEDAYHVFALGSCQPPRNIGIWYPESPDGVTNAPVPILFRGSLHSHLEQHESGSNLIMVFDTMAESCWQMHSPVRGSPSLLFEMDGMLAMYSLYAAATVIDIWVLQDYKTVAWAFKCRVQLPVEEMRVFQKFTSDLDVMVMSSDDDVLVLVLSGGWLLQIDINGKLVNGFLRERLGFTPLRLKQTLVLHNFFPTQ
ncbi:unnamed protein product [Alopecurus aequalis]